MQRRFIVVFIILTLLLTSCDTAMTASDQDVPIVLAKGTDTERPEGWTDATHAKSADPDYDIVFPQDEVKRLDIVITPTDWLAMLDDMTELYGEAGARKDERMPPGDGEIPEGWGPQQGDGLPEGGSPPEGGRPPAGEVPPEGWSPPEGGALPDDQAFPRMPGGEVPDIGAHPPMGHGGRGQMLDSSVNPIYVPVTVVFKGMTWTHVGMRFKGNSSLRSAWGSNNMKLPFRLDFDQFEDDYPEIDDQRFYGFKQLAFSSGFSDASFLREKVTADIFREAGVPAAQTAFYEVYVDYGEGPIYFGLYTLTEIVDDTVVETQFDDDDGNVYKPEGIGASFAAGSFDEQAFEKQSNQDEGDWSDVKSLYEVLHADTRTSTPEAWRSDLEAVFDAKGFLNWLAVNTVVQNWDTYGAMTHNYYLYHDPTTDQLVWIPWDNNMALSSNRGMRQVLTLDMGSVDDSWPLIRYLLDDPVYYAQYVDNVHAVIQGAFEPTKMEATYRELAALVEPYVLKENMEHTYLQSDEAFYTAIETLVQHAYARYEVATEFVTNAK